MATTLKPLARTALTTTTSTVLYTTPAATVTTITEIDVANTAATAATVTLSLNGVVLLPTISIPANSVYSWSGKQVLNATNTITGGASATTVNIHISGVEVA